MSERQRKIDLIQILSDNIDRELITAKKNKNPVEAHDSDWKPISEKTDFWEINETSDWTDLRDNISEINEIFER